MTPLKQHRNNAKSDDSEPLGQHKINQRNNDSDPFRQHKTDAKLTIVISRDNIGNDPPINVGDTPKTT